MIDFLTKPENFYEVKSDSFKDSLMALIEVVTGRDLNKKNLIPAFKPAVREKTPLKSVQSWQEERHLPIPFLRNIALRSE